MEIRKYFELSNEGLSEFVRLDKETGLRGNFVALNAKKQKGLKKIWVLSQAGTKIKPEENWIMKLTGNDEIEHCIQ